MQLLATMTFSKVEVRLSQNQRRWIIRTKEPVVGPRGFIRSSLVLPGSVVVGRMVAVFQWG